MFVSCQQKNQDQVIDLNFANLIRSSQAIFCYDTSQSNT